MQALIDQAVGGVQTLLVDEIKVLSDQADAHQKRLDAQQAAASASQRRITALGTTQAELLGRIEQLESAVQQASATAEQALARLAAVSSMDPVAAPAAQCKPSGCDEPSVDADAAENLALRAPKGQVRISDSTCEVDVCALAAKVDAISTAAAPPA